MTWGGAGRESWEFPTVGMGSADAIVARALATVPGFERWSHESLPLELEKSLPSLDDQQLMTVAAAALLRLMQNQRAAA